MAGRRDGFSGARHAALLALLLIAGAGCGNGPRADGTATQAATPSAAQPTGTPDRGGLATSTPTPARRRPAAKPDEQPTADDDAQAAAVVPPHRQARPVNRNSQAERARCNASFPRQLARCDAAAK